MNLLIYSTHSYDRTFFEAAKPAFGHTISYTEAALNPLSAAMAKGYNAVCIFVNDQADAPTLQTLADNGIKTIALRCAGYNNVDVQAALRLGITLVRVPAYSPEAVAEHAVAMILTLNRKTHKAYNRVREGNFSLERLTGFNLHKKTVGIIGLGKIGLAFSRIMLGFGCRVLAFDPLVKTAPEGVSLSPFNVLLAESDIISVHCPLTPDTKHLIGAEQFAALKTGAMLINTSRGAVINAHDALEALRQGKLGYLGLDVYEQEENLFFKDLSESIITDELITQLIGFPNVLVTAHQAFFTHEALTEIAEITLQNLTDTESGTGSPNRINP